MGILTMQAVLPAMVILWTHKQRRHEHGGVLLSVMSNQKG